MKKIIIANWKMNKTIDKAISFVRKLNKMNNVDVAVCPSFTALYPVSQVLKKRKVKLCAQDIFYEEKGAFTGEVSPKMLKDMKVDFVILGHSERREYFNESDEEINKKIKAALKYKIKPILCVGENLKQKRQGKTKAVVGKQLRRCLKGLKRDEFSKIIIAYEPIWAIGTGVSETPEETQKVHSFIRSLLGKKLRIIYGGSVNPKNIKSLLEMKDIDGALIGGASLDIGSFKKIIGLCS